MVCGSCHSLIDALDENYRILQAYNERTSQFWPVLSLGSRGELFGKKWEVIGYMVREDLASGYKWQEYLLFNPYYGYRWLTQGQSHWNFVTPIKEIPDTSPGSSYSASYRGKKFKIFDRGSARVVYVIGEFYWRVSVDSTVFMEDYVCPPLMLSMEKDQNEFNWSVGEYVTPDVIRNAFKVRASLISNPVGIAPNQVSVASQDFNIMKPWWLLFLLILTVGQFYELSQCKNKTALVHGISFIPDCKSSKDVTTPVFTLDKGNNVEIQISAPVDNSWLYVSGELVNNDTGVSYSFDRSVEYYHGYDDGEYWTEGSNHESVLVPTVPAGRYYINLDYESGMYTDFNQRTFSLAVVRDVPAFGNYLWCLLFVSILPLFYWWMSHADEVKRWSNSDYSPYPSSSNVIESSSDY